ncbi:MAG: HDIG domain-containing protein [Bacteroidales bacterium]|nr:HDIG domain-containing protein [Bacteroidales bacterium]
MNRVVNYIKINYRILFRIFLFLITALVIVYLFPREGKFQYEFQKGYPWRHDVLLIAPFDFSIYKTDQEMQAERDSVLSQLHPYFVYDTGRFDIQKQIFLNEIDKRWTDFLIANYSVTRLSDIKSSSKRNQLEQLKKMLTDNIISLVKAVYDKGVIETNGFEEVINRPDYQINIVKNNLAEEHSVTDVFTPKKAYEFLIKFSSDLNIEIDRNKKFDITSFVRNLNLNAFIVPNIIYDDETTEKVKNDKLDNLSNRYGKVAQGEKIIAKGEPVTGEAYRKLQSLKIEYEKRLGESVRTTFILIGKVVLAFLALFLLYMFLWNYRKAVLANTLHVSFILFIVLLMIFFASIALKFSDIMYYIIPFALLPILIRTFFDARLALFVHVVTILLIGFFAPNGFEFVFMNIMAGIVAVISLTNLYRRARLVYSAFFIILTYSAVYLGIAVMQEGTFVNINWNNIGWFSISGLLVLVAYPLIYVFEKTFNFLSDATLMELSDTNQPLLRKLAEKAPGTFQHSLQVANLAESAIAKIEGNPLLVRAGALYHDIGKMDNPEFFIENLGKDYNPHESMSFEESARTIINHVERGIEMGRKYKLPEQIINFIRTHHGDSTVQYFYRSYLKEFPDAEVDIKKFSYPGPRPFSKETAVLMMADATEAASRSLKKITEESITELVESIIGNQIKNNQFNVAPITFEDITNIKQTFIKKLKNIYHARIEYPK